MTLWHTIRWLLSLVGSTALSLGFAQLALSQTSAETNRGGAYAPQGIALRNTTLAAAEARALNAGPIHEAFLEPLSTNVEPSIVVRNEPPQPIDETPPAYRPEAANLEWIPGYWMWLEQQNDFVWVSGLWRAVPPGRTWTPGHWATIDDGYGWINGFWSDGNTPELQYLPYPPESLEQESRSEAPDANHFWIPGCWQWEGEQDQYAWRPGHWYPGQSNWLWVPHHYVYTPRGAVLVRGYWDYPIERRGLLYAPVYWNGGYHYGAGYSYTPNRVINTALLLGSLFVDNNHGNYYYGNRYAGHNNYAPGTRRAEAATGTTAPCRAITLGNTDTIATIGVHVSMAPISGAATTSTTAAIGAIEMRTRRLSEPSMTFGASMPMASGVIPMAIEINAVLSAGQATSSAS